MNLHRMRKNGCNLWRFFVKLSNATFTTKSQGKVKKKGYCTRLPKQTAQLAVNGYHSEYPLFLPSDSLKRSASDKIDWKNDGKDLSFLCLQSEMSFGLNVASSFVLFLKRALSRARPTPNQNKQKFFCLKPPNFKNNLNTFSS